MKRGDEVMIYWSKIDTWLLLLVGFGILGAVAVGISAPPQGSVGRWLAIIGLPLVLFLFAFPVSYRVSTSELTIRSGVLLRWKIPLEAIQDVYPTRNPLGSPAWSLDRLHIRYSRGAKLASILISPKNKSDFLRELVARHAGLQLWGDHVTRSSGGAQKLSC